jgi:hypothetical protein
VLLVVEVLVELMCNAVVVVIMEIVVKGGKAVFVL